MRKHNSFDAVCFYAQLINLMKLFRRKRPKKIRKPVRDPLQVIALGFALIILIGAFVLTLPVSSRTGQPTNFITALFTATTSTCVTGLVVVDTFTHWSFFGQCVILVMIQIGGMGFMLMLAALSIFVGRKITIRERVLIGKSISLDSMSGIVRLSKRIIASMFFVEGFGAVILALRFTKDFPLKTAIWKGVFHSVSAFCNAGIDTLGEIGGPFCSLAPYAGDFTVTMTVALLVILGGLGFYVWDDVLSYKEGRRLSLHSKLVLTTTTALLAGGTIFYLIAEWSNPLTLQNKNIFDKILLSFFQSASTRTAGMDQLGQANLTPASTVMTMLLMFIGGSPGSTAGGVKTVTVTLLILTAINTLRGRNSIVVYGRNLSYRYVLDAVTIIMVGVVCVFGGTLMLSMIDGVAFEAAMFECMSAFATVGLSTGITPTLSPLSQLLLIGMMYIGRVGIITLGLAIVVRGKKETNIRYPEGKIIVG